MTVWPLVTRELQVNARRRQTYTGRMVTAGVCALVGMGSAVAMARTGFSNRLGTMLFASVAGMTAMFGLFIGAGSTSDCISGEKREGTLGLLFLTALRPVDVVVGKLAACSLLSFFGLLTVIPILALAVLLGGVQGEQVVGMGLALGNTLFFAATWGLLTSTLTRRADHAAAAAMGGVVFFWFGCGLFAQALSALKVAAGVGWWLRVMSPQTAVEMALGPVTGRTGSFFWAALGTSHGLAWGFLAAAVWILPRVWQDRVGGAKGLPWGERMAQRRLGTPARRAAYRRAALAVGPFYWMALRQPGRRWDAWWLLGVVGAGVAGVASWYGSSVDLGMLGVGAMAVLHFAFRAWIASESGRHLAEERQNGTLEMLLSTPLTAEEVIRGQWLAVWRMFAWPLGVVVAVDLGIAVWMGMGWWEEPPPREFAWVVVGAAGVMLWDCVAIFYTALWAAVTEKRAQAVGGNALARVLFLPWLFLLAILLGGVFLFGGGPGPPLSGKAFGGCWFVLSVANSWFWFARSRARLRREFRERAIERYLPDGERPGWWQAWWARWRGGRDRGRLG